MDNEKINNINGSILCVDAMNMFIRSFAVINTTDDQGSHSGGIFGIFQSLKVMIELFKPSKIIFCWEGKNSSKRRKQLLPEYKQDRTVRKSLNRTFEWETPEEEWIAFKKQLYRIKQYLDTMPIVQLEVENQEADDLIAYVSNYCFPNNNKIIISSDKDYFQLISNSVSVFRPIKKELITTNKMLEEYGCSPKNWILMKCIIGDKSDSVAGIKGIGIKTAIKLFPFLSEDKEYSILDVINWGIEHKGQNPKYEKFSNLEIQEMLKVSYKVMQLMTHEISATSITKIRDLVEKEKTEFKPFQLRLLFLQDGATKQNDYFESWTKLFLPLIQQ